LVYTRLKVDQKKQGQGGSALSSLINGQSDRKRGGMERRKT
jgi:hypothetical protein